MKRVISCIAFLAIIFSMLPAQVFAEGVSAAEPVIIERRASELIKSYSCSLTRSGKTLSASCTLTAKDIVDQIGVTNFSIQEKRNGSWVSVKSLVGDYNYNRLLYSGGLTYTGKEGYEYRAVAHFYVKDGSLSDTATKTSARKEIPAT